MASAARTSAIEESTPAASIEYESLLKRTADERSTVKVHGVLAKKPSQGITGPRGCIPILWCFCVHDSPDSPCPCMGPIIWIPEKQILHIRKSKRPNERKGGDPLVEIEIAPDARVFADETQKVTPQQTANTKLLRSGPNGVFSRVEETLWIQQYYPMRAATLIRALELIGSNPRLEAIAKKKGIGGWARLVAAFEFGWEVGEYIDEKTGLSDAIADWLFENLGPFDELF